MTVTLIDAATATVVLTAECTKRPAEGGLCEAEVRLLFDPVTTSYGVEVVWDGYDDDGVSKIYTERTDGAPLPSRVAAYGAFALILDRLEDDGWRVTGAPR